MSRSTTRSRHQLQCRRMRDGRQCGLRKTVKRAPERYVRWPRCPICRAPMVDVTRARQRERARAGTCSCLAYPFPHRAGSLRMCSQHALSTVDPTTDEIRDYESVLNTPRNQR